MRTLREEALDSGVHPECFSGGPEQACEKCRRTVLDLMHDRYGNVDNDRLVTVIATDQVNGTL